MISEERDRDAQRLDPESDWHLPSEISAAMKSNPTPHRIACIRFYEHLLRSQIIFLVVLRASSLQFTAPAASDSTCPYNFSVVLKTSNPKLGGLGSDANVLT